jgi:hypothetical protein
MKKLIFATVIAAVIPLALAVAEDQPKDKIKKESGGTKAKPSESMSLNYEQIKYGPTVPAGKKYVIFNAQGKKIADFKAGQKSSVTKDCAQTPCPPSFGKDTVCWKCVERIKPATNSKIDKDDLKSWRVNHGTGN